MDVLCTIAISEETYENLFRKKLHTEIEMNDRMFYSPPSCSRIICKPKHKKMNENKKFKILPSSFFNGFKRF